MIITLIICLTIIGIIILNHKYSCKHNFVEVLRKETQYRKVYTRGSGTMLTIIYRCEHCGKLKKYTTDYLNNY